MSIVSLSGNVHVSVYVNVCVENRSECETLHKQNEQNLWEKWNKQTKIAHRGAAGSCVKAYS